MELIQSKAINSNGGSSKTFNVSLEGNIGSGKTTFLRQCSNNGEFELVEEPLSEWADVGGVNLLSEFYSDPAAWAFRFQSYITLTMLKGYLKPTSKPIKIMERSLWSARNCFVEQMLADGVLNQMEHAILEGWYYFIDQQHNMRPDLIVYLRTLPAIAHNRMTGHGRPSEARYTQLLLSLI